MELGSTSLARLGSTTTRGSAGQLVALEGGHFAREIGDLGSECLDGGKKSSGVRDSHDESG